MIPTTITHSTEAQNRLTDAFRGRIVVEGILKSAMAPLQLVETSIFDQLEKRKIDIATNHALDMIGALVGEDRQGKTDAEYRAAIKLRIRINVSSGRAVDLAEIARLVHASAKYVEGDDAAFIIKAYGLTTLFAILQALKPARPAGVYGVLEYSTWTDTNDMKYSSTRDGTAGANFFSSTTEGTVRGVLVGAQAIP